MTRTTFDVDLLIRFDRGAFSPLHAQLERQLRDAILTGTLRPDTPLPATRALATELGVSRGVVVEAYEQLRAEGYLIAERGSRTRVSTLAGDQAPTVGNARRPEPVVRFDFRTGTPDLSLLPARCLAHSDDARAQHDARRPARLRRRPRHRRAARGAGRLPRAGTGARVDPERTIITTGLVQALVLVGRTLRARGARRLAVEDPGSADAWVPLTSAGLELIRVEVDDRGLRVDQLQLTDADAVFVTPAHQSPPGWCSRPSGAPS